MIITRVFDPFASLADMRADENELNAVVESVMPLSSKRYENELNVANSYPQCIARDNSQRNPEEAQASGAANWGHGAYVNN